MRLLHSCERLVGWGLARPIAGLWIAATITSLPGLAILLPSLSVDPDMVTVGPAMLALPAHDLGRLFTHPWKDGSWRPLVFLSWWLDGRVWGDHARGWAFTCWVLGVACAAMLGMLVLRTTGRLGAAYVAAALMGLRQSVPAHRGLLGQPFFIWVLLLPMLAWLVLKLLRSPAAAALIGRLIESVALALVIFRIEWIDQTMVPTYVGGQVALQGAFFSLLCALVALHYADRGSRWALLAFCALWAMMSMSYEQPLCLPLAMAPVFLMAVPRRRWARALPLLAGAAILTAAYLALRLHFVSVHGFSSYQRYQLRSGSVWVWDVVEYAFPPAFLLWLPRMLPKASPLLVPFVLPWSLIVSSAAWVIAYWRPFTRSRQVRAWYFWKVIAFLPLARFHQHPHYSYFPQMAATAVHGLMVDAWASRLGLHLRRPAAPAAPPAASEGQPRR